VIHPRTQNWSILNNAFDPDGAATCIDGKR
jgi:hypothetical protein